MDFETKNSFVLYSNYYEILSDLSDEQMGKLFRAILEYKTTGKQPVVSVDLLVVFKFIKNQIDIDTEKYMAKVARNRQNGKKGGAPKGNQNARKQPKTTQNKHNENENENENENDIIINVDDDVFQKNQKNVTLDQVPDIVKENKNIKNPCAYWANLPEDAKERMKNQKKVKSRGEILSENTQKVLAEMEYARQNAVDPPPDFFEKVRKGFVRKEHK